MGQPTSITLATFNMNATAAFATRTTMPAFHTKAISNVFHSVANAIKRFMTAHTGA